MWEISGAGPNWSSIGNEGRGFNTILSDVLLSVCMAGPDSVARLLERRQSLA